MPFNPSLPSCFSCMANTGQKLLLITLLITAFWPATAIVSLADETSITRLAGPTHRVQPRTSSQAVTSPTKPQQQQESSQRFILPNLNLSFRSLLLQKANQVTPVSFQRKPDQRPGLTELPQPTEPSEEVKKPSDDATTNIATQQCQPGRPISDLTTDIALPAGQLPTDIAAHCIEANPPAADPRTHGHWAWTSHHWAATGMHHKPLYFEEINAERYGYTASYFLQPLISAGRFYLTIPALPYKMAVECPRQCTYTLGQYRPGSCVPWRRQKWPLKATGAAAQVGVVAGLILLIP